MPTRPRHPPTTGPNLRAATNAPTFAVTAPSPRGALPSLLAVFVGGIVGTFARLLLDTVLPHSDTDFPTSTLLINVVGSAVLGFLVARVWPTAAPWLRAGLGTGVLGSFTTFSAVVVALVTLVEDGRMTHAALYLGLSLVLGFAAALGGLRLGRR